MPRQNAAWMPDPNTPRFHAVVIGINSYPFSKLPTLKAAVSDADAFERYLIEYLRVPFHNIRNLRNETATRSNILNTLHFLQVDPNILPGDAIIIYYSGHGGTSPAPPGWEAEGGVIQMILPSDFGPSVYGIPDRTIGIMLENLAIARGDNITVVFDCCFSGSGTRSHNPEEQIRGVRIAYPPPPRLDGQILAVNNCGIAVPGRFLHSGLRSHVLLAACSSGERAREAQGWGRFTKVLLGALKSIKVDEITYTELIRDHLPKLPTQNPQCEGYNRNRILFNTRVTSRSFFHRIARVVGEVLEIGVGGAYGITQDALFTPYPSRQHANSDHALLGPIKPLQITPFKTLLAIPHEIFTAMSWDDVVLQVQAGGKGAFPICISDESVGLHSLVDRVHNEMKRHGMRDLVVVGEGSAKLGLGLQLDKSVVALRILDPSICRWGLNTICYTVPFSQDALFHVLSTAAYFDWELHRESRGIGMSQVDIEFTRLQETMDRWYIDSWTSVKKLEPYGPNMIETKHGGHVVFVDVSEGSIYGMKLRSKINVPLYVTVLYFDSSDLTIKLLQESSISTSQSTAEAPLKPHQGLTIGYGSSGFPPFNFLLSEAQAVGVGTLKIYFSTEPVDLAYLRQEPQSRSRAGGPASDTRRGYPQRAAWGTVEVQVVQERART